MKAKPIDRGQMEIKCGTTRHRQGRFKTLDEAVAAHRKKAFELFGDFAERAVGG